MRILGLDLGTKTLGVSVCDNTETIASFIGTIRFTENKPEEFAACARREAIRMRDEIRNAVNNL